MLNSDIPRASERPPTQGPSGVVIDMAGMRVKHDGPVSEPADAADVAVIDWDILFSAVTSKLQQIAGSVRPSEPLPRDAPAQVLQCVAALDQLHSTMVHYIERGGALELELARAQAALAEVRAELARTEAGERAARHRAAHDGLTSLPNGSGFRERLAHLVNEAAARGQAFAVLYIDLDGFKAISDAHGHAVGDELLRVIAARLRVAVRAEDMVSRLGGDEFACLLWIAPPQRKALVRLARSLFDTVSAPFQIGALTLVVKPSIGIAMWPGDGLTAERLIESADAAMVCAKREHSGHAFFDQGSHPGHPLQATPPA